MKTRSCAIAFGSALWVCGLGMAAERKSVQVDAKDVVLPEVVRLLAAQGGPTLLVHPEVAGEKVTFAAKGMPAWATVRWLCRVCNLIVGEGKDGRLTLGRPTIEPSVDKEYAVAKVAPTQEATDALVNFIKKVIFELHPIRAKGEQGVPEPVCDVVYEKGKLKVSAPPVMQREVTTLLRAVARVQPRRGLEDIRVAYESHEIGFLGPRAPATPPRLVGEVTLSLADAPPAEAVWALTSACKGTSFYVDPWDRALDAARVTVQAEKQPLKEVVDSIAKQLGTERCWHDDAWVFVRAERRPLFDGLLARAYNISGGGWQGRFFREAMRGLGNLPKTLPYTVERADDLVLVCATPDAHKAVEDFVKAADDAPPRHLPGGPGRKWR